MTTEPTTETIERKRASIMAEIAHAITTYNAKAAVHAHAIEMAAKVRAELDAVCTAASVDAAEAHKHLMALYRELHATYPDVGA